MTTLTYCKGLPTPESEMNSLGFTELEMFLSAYAPIFHEAACETVNHLLASSGFDKSKWNTHLQQSYGISKRHANGESSAAGGSPAVGDAAFPKGVISFASGAFGAASESRKLHIKTKIGKLKSALEWIKKAEKKLKNARKFYKKKNWTQSKTGCQFPLSCSIQFRDTNWQYLRFQLHNKKRPSGSGVAYGGKPHRRHPSHRVHHLTKQIQHLRLAPIRVVIPRSQVFIVGSKDESYGNQVCQWNGNTIKIRVPSCLESRFGKLVCSEIGAPST